MRRIAGWLRTFADRLDPPEPAKGDRWVPFPAPEPFSEPIDFDAMWRGHVTDGAAYIDDEDVYRPGGGTYL